MPNDPQIPGVDIAATNQPGYHPLIESDGDWIAAVLNGSLNSWAAPDLIEQHPPTDELFVLVAGRARLIIAGDGKHPGPLQQIEMQRNVLYNVKKSVWHATPMSSDAKLLIIERNPKGVTGFTNRQPLTAAQKANLPPLA